MEPPHFAFKELFTHMIGEIAKAICDRPNETPQQRLTRIQAASHMVLELRPRDVIECILAGQMVMFHELITDSVHETLRGQVDTLRRATRSTIVSLNKAFLQTLVQFEHYQARRADGMREATEASPTSDPAVAQEPQSEIDPVELAMSGRYNPSREQIAACQANPEAMAALEAGDAAGFARALGVEYPSEAYLTAALEDDVFTGKQRPKSNGHARPSR